MDRDTNYWHDWMRRRSSRRTVLRLAGGVGAVGLLSACAPTQQSATGSSTGTQGGGSTEGVPQILKHGIANAPVTLDPNGTALSSTYFYAIYDAMTRVDQNANVHPGLAESWKPVDDTTWEFKIRVAKWSDGSELTADDVKWTWDYVRDPANKSAIASRVTNVTDVRVVDPRTVQIKTEGPDPLLAKRAFFVPILPKAYIAKVGIQQFGNVPIGTGAYKIKEYKRGERAVLVPSETSWRKPKLQEVWLFEMPEDTTRVAALRTGEIDVSDALGTENAQSLKSEGNLQILVADGAGAFNWDIEFFKDPYKDKRVRLAFNHAVDKDAILKNLLQGYGRVMDGQLIPKNVFGYNPNLKPIEYDPKKAKDLLTAAGVGNGFDTVIEYRAQTADEKVLAEAMVPYFQTVGIKAELKPVETPVWRQHLYEGGRAPIFLNTWSAQAALDAEFILNWYSAGSFGGKPYWKNDAFEAAYSKSQTELDATKRLGYLQAASAAMLEDPPTLFFIQRTTLWGVNKKVRGFAGTASSYIWYDDIDIIKA